VDTLLTALKAVAEPTRLRLLALLAQGELTVSELVRILGQSQPRVSRHLRLLTEAGVLDRFQEGSWVFHRLAQGDREGSTAGADLAQHLTAQLSPEDPVLKGDQTRLMEVKRTRAEAAARYFAANAGQWDEIRSLQVDEQEVERVILNLLPVSKVSGPAFGPVSGPVFDQASGLLDIGTGTGRMLEILGPRYRHGHGIDLSHEMLSVARANLHKAGLDHCQVQKGDMYQLPFAAEAFDGVIIHQVLHFADRPQEPIAEAARVLGPGGRLVVVDFAPHKLETLRDDHEHRRLGFSDKEVAGWIDAAHLQLSGIHHLPGTPLTVTVWWGDKAITQNSIKGSADART